VNVAKLGSKEISYLERESGRGQGRGKESETEIEERNRKIVGKDRKER
jgi:hypothetical protein